MASSTRLIPDADHSISIEKAKEMTKRFREQKDLMLIPDVRALDVFTICETFNRHAFDRILEQQACVAIRIYYGMTPERKIRVIAVGVDAENNDLLPSATVAGKDPGVPPPPPPPPPTEEGTPCPPLCPRTPL